MFASIYDKTDKGRQEIATRQFQLQNRLRTLLVMVDGKQSAAELLRKVQALGLDENSIQELIDGDFISRLKTALKLRLPRQPGRTCLSPCSTRWNRLIIPQYRLLSLIPRHRNCLVLSNSRRYTGFSMKRSRPTWAFAALHCSLR